MAIRNEPRVAEAIMGQLLSGTDASTPFEHGPL